MPEASASIPATQPQIERNYRWNFLVNAPDGTSFWFGMSFISSTIILPLYVSHFTHNPLWIAPLLGGWLAGAISYPAMFILAAIIGVMSWGLLRFTVRDPRQMSVKNPV